ncbi:hypothetical protein V1477_005286 [Vespula maculifrons]|uniref:Uncharacterized protein n=1 Tax=Vespula maculifrons TaxID=7453 RepID=A0ABD2CPB4_VESMC
MLGAVLSTYIPSAFAPASTPPNPDTVVTARGEQGKPLGQGEQASIAGTGAGAGAGADAGAGAGAGVGAGVGAVAAAATSAAITFSSCSSSSGDASGGLSRYPAAQIRILATHAPGFLSSFPGATLSRSAQWPCALSIDPSSLYANTGLPWELFLPWNIGDITWDSVPGTLHKQEYFRYGSTRVKTVLKPVRRESFVSNDRDKQWNAEIFFQLEHEKSFRKRFCDRMKAKFMVFVILETEMR